MEEIWKDIPNYDGLYQVSNLGNVKSLNYKLKGIEKELAKNLEKVGYYTVGLYKNKNQNTYRIHNLVAMTFLNHIPCGYKLVVNHKNFNKLDNRVENLEIVTQRENANFKHIKSSSIYVGVSWCKRNKKWHSSISIGLKKKFLGYFKTEIEAYNAYLNKLNKINYE